MTQSLRRQRAVRIGLSGPIGCGKSTIARWLGERRGVVVVDADQVARDVLDPGEPALDAVAARFGREVLKSDGSLDRAALGRIVFADPAALSELEAIVHPVVRPRIMAGIAAADRDGALAVIVEAIKLVESGLAEACDEVWLVTCDPATQRARLIGRGSSDSEAEQRMTAQAGALERVRPIATRVIDTSGDAIETRRLVEVALDDAIARARAGRR